MSPGIPARQSLAAQLVSKDDLPNAIALNSAAFNGARVIGPAIAGLVVGAVGEGWCFFFNGASFVAVIAGLLLMRLSRPAPRAPGSSAASEIAEGFAFVARSRPVRALLLLLGLVSLGSMPYVTLMPIFADRILGGGPRTLGLLMGASGVGAVAGGLMVQMAGSNTLLQRMVPDALRGRVMAVYSMMFMGMAPFGALIGGALAARIGPPAAAAMGGAACAVRAAVFALRLGDIRAEARAMVQARRSEGERRA